MGMVYRGKSIQREGGSRAEPLRSNEEGPSTGDWEGVDRDVVRKPRKCGVLEAKEECSL